MIKTPTTTSKKTPIDLYNFRTRSLENFQPLGQEVGLYTCGPTVYDTAHIGNLRTYLFEDVLKRTLAYFGYPVRHVMNITDVEDKIIRSANQAKTSIAEFTAPYREKFLADLATLNIKPADVLADATAHVPEMIDLISKLMDKGLAYEVDGSVYFSIQKFPAYGQLAGVDLSGLRAGARVDVDEYDKNAAQDFVLWKAAKDEDRAVGAVWDSPWGQGRPGWHIECSAMSMKYLGETFDLHAGGIDLLFPHHEDEIAQSQGATGKPFAQIFVEGEHILVDNQKMAKSLGNIITLEEIEKKGIEPLAFRYLVLSTHYRSKLNFTWQSLAAAATTLEHIRQLQYRPAEPVSDDLRQAIDHALADDLDTPRVLALLQESNNSAAWEAYEQVLGLGIKSVTVEVPDDIQTLMTQREDARKIKDFWQADRLREKLKHKGWDVEDTPEGPRVLPNTSKQ